MLLSLLYLAISCITLAWGADRFVTGASATAAYFKLPPFLIGVVLVGFATSFPEMLVSLLAALKQQPEIALGNAIGSYITNISLVLGVTLLVAPLAIRSQLLRREYGIMTVTLFIVWVFLSNGYLSRLEGAIMLLIFISLFSAMVYFAWCKKNAAGIKQGQDTWLQACEYTMTSSPVSLLRAFFLLVIGFVSLYLSSHLLIYSASAIARHLGVSELTIGLTIVAVGTSLPELAASVASALKKEPDIALGNVIGSNIFGLLVVTAMPGLFAPGKISNVLLWREFPIMVVITALLFLLGGGLRQNSLLTRPQGVVLLLSFIVYLALIFII